MTQAATQTSVSNRNDIQTAQTGTASTIVAYTSTVPPPSVEAIAGGINLDSDAGIQGYGQAPSSADTLGHITQLLERTPVNRMSEQLALVLRALNGADPAQVCTRPNWLQRFTGVVEETRLRYQASQAEVDEGLKRCLVVADDLRHLQDQIASLMIEAESDIAFLGAHIAAGDLYLRSNQSAGLPASEGIQFENRRERFSRRIANLKALKASHELSLGQLKLVKATIIDLIDRFHEISQTLVPMWRQHALAIAISETVNPDILRKATQAHSALITALSDNLHHAH